MTYQTTSGKILQDLHRKAIEELGGETPRSLPFSTTDSHDPVRSPEHYRTESGVEVIDLVEDLDFLTGNIVKYAFRAGKKRGSPELQDLEKCESYLNRAIARAKRRKA